MFRVLKYCRLQRRVKTKAPIASARFRKNEPTIMLRRNTPIDRNMTGDEQYMMRQRV